MDVVVLGGRLASLYISKETPPGEAEDRRIHEMGTLYSFGEPRRRKGILFLKEEVRQLGIREGGANSTRDTKRGGGVRPTKKIIAGKGNTPKKSGRGGGETMTTLSKRSFTHQRREHVPCFTLEEEV